MLNIVADENIPCVEAFFSPYGRVKTLPGRSMTAEDLEGADILLVRSVTKVNEALLAKSSVKFVGTCTIGVDHLDKVYFRENNIQYASAPGCNAGGVVQYALSAMAHLQPGWQQKRIGIIGCGNVGGRLNKTLLALGVDCVAYDPFLNTDQVANLCTWEDVLKCEIICAHTPLTREGPYPSFHMIGADALSTIADGTLLLNAGRGEVIDNQALLAAKKSGRDITVVLDVWENEPEVLLPLVEHVAIGTPHIAGYSYEGRLNGSKMIHQALGKFLKVDQSKIDAHEQKVLETVLGEMIPLGGGDKGALSFDDAVKLTYPIFEDDERFRNAMAEDKPKQAFDALRKSYWKRREFTQYEVAQVIESDGKGLNTVGFELLKK